MAPEKVTDMVLNIADLKCPCCYKKVKKLLCKFPQVRNQVFDEKQNTVSITVVCCSPEEIRHKLAKKGGKTVKSVVIKEPGPKPKPDPKPEKPNESENLPKSSDPKPDKPKGDNKPDKPKGDVEKPDKPKGEVEVKVVVEKPKEMIMAAAAAQVPMGYPYGMAVAPPAYYPGEASGYGGGGYMRAVPAYDNYGYRSESEYYYGNNNRPGNDYYYWNEENPTGCTIM